MQPDMSKPGAVWLADAHRVPEQVWREWSDGLAPALVPVGEKWDAVCMPYDRMLAVMADMGRFAWEHRPVLADLTVGRVYMLLPVGTADTWDEPGTTALGQDSWLVVSQPGGRQVDAGTWVQAPDAIVRLVDAEELRASLRRTSQEQESAR